MSNSNRGNSGYVMPDKGRGKVNLAGQDFGLTCTWAGADKQRLNIDGQANGTGFVTPNAHKTKDSQPDWRGEWVDGQKKKWLLSAWAKARDNDTMFSLSFTDPATLPARAPASGAAPAPAPAPSPAAPPADPNSVTIGADDFTNFEIGDPFNQ